MPDSARSGPEQLKQVQAQFAAAIMAPLTRDWEIQPIAENGRPMAEVAADFVKPNDRLTSIERLEIYNRQYWFRLIDIMYEDYPGLGAILGRQRFVKFCKAYLTRHPSGSTLLRDLGRHLEEFVRAAPQLTSPYTDMALDMAQFEWAQVEAFDAAQKPPLTTDDLLGKDPATMRLTLQPSITLLDMRYAVDQLVIAVKKQVLRRETSNASDGTSSRRQRRQPAKKDRACVVVHRVDNSVYIKRLEPAAFAILAALRDGSTIREAIEQATTESSDADTWAKKVGEWFEQWMSFGWFCREK